MINSLKKYFYDARVPLYLIGLMGFLFVIYLYNWITQFEINTPESQQTRLAVVQHVQPAITIGQWHIFGIYQDTLQNLPETALPLTLEGILLDLNSPGQSYAIISDAAGSSHVYKPGDLLPSGATLKQILQEQVILTYQGTLQSLSLPIDRL